MTTTIVKLMKFAHLSRLAPSTTPTHQCLLASVTRTKNATQHPGLVDAVPKKKRRTAAEVAAERQAKLDAKEEKERAKGAGIKRVAEYEKKQAEKDASTDATPRAAVLPKSKPRPKPIPKKTRAKSPTLPPEDDRFISDVEMDDSRH
ncbi:uncharacterized protein F5147DRAFT_778857 [Suillus discolor]|uniref:Uncharacterized protein n=1 Tax=Suillus discolor TaxID=1912936 RepID=A0A9P7EXM8_9AGAM|nr:uncharacterized protein F5147DRAFT_778857 [Suillus discolor]KAG2094830.1 hypothetical protein F5147DRAFT_778857 [Suillus discolor]